MKVELVREMCGWLRLNCSLEVADHKEYGGLDETGKPTGLVADAVAGRFDVLEPEFAPTADRLRVSQPEETRPSEGREERGTQVLDASKTVYMERMLLVTRFPDKAGFRFSSIFAFDYNVYFSLPFSSSHSSSQPTEQVWLLILASVLIVALLSFLFNALSWRKLRFVRYAQVPKTVRIPNTPRYLLLVWSCWCPGRFEGFPDN